MKVNYSKTEMKFLIKQLVKIRWQKQREEERTGRWLYNIQRSVGKGRITRRNRKNPLYLNLVTQHLTDKYSHSFITGLGGVMADNNTTLRKINRGFTKNKTKTMVTIVKPW